MFHNRDNVESEESVSSGFGSGSFDIISNFFNGVRPFSSRSELIKLFEFVRISRDLWEEPGISVRV